MTRRFDEALDACMTLIMQGATVDECLARYPDEAEDLRLHLLAFADAARAASIPVGPEAKARGRARLRAELAALEERDQTRLAAPPWSGWFRGWWPALPIQRWAIAAVAALLLVLGGTGTLAASRGTLPGDTFYPVKIATEQARLALVISEPDKASLHVSFAEKRAREISALLERGEAEQAVAVAGRLASHLEAAGRLSASATVETRSALQEKLAKSSAQALAALQVSLVTAAADDEPNVEKTFDTAGTAYSRAIENVAGTETRPVATALEPGTLQLRASDPPPPGVDEILATILRVEAYLSSGREKGWVTVIEGPLTFDLKQASELPRYLGERAVAAGTYTRLRIQLGDATVLAGGVSHQASLTATSFELTRPFRVDSRKTTVVVLDFDGIDTVRVSPGGQFVFTPDVRLLAQEPGVKPVEPERRTPRPTPATEATVTAPTPIPPVAEVVGELEAVTEGSITVHGKQIELEVRPPEAAQIEKGTKVRVEVQTEEDGRFRARQIEVIGTPVKKDEKEPKDQQPVSEAGPAPQASPTPEVPAEFTGIVGAIEGDRWIVAGRRVAITDQTKLSANPTVGMVARIIGVLGSDGVIRASVVIFEPAPPRPVEPTPTPTPRATPEPRAAPEAKGKAERRVESETAPVVQVVGILTAITADIWEVGGRKIKVPASSPVVGVPAIGAEVQVVGRELGDGTILAVTVKIRIKGEGLPVPFRSPVPLTPDPSQLPATATETGPSSPKEERRPSDTSKPDDARRPPEPQSISPTRSPRTPEQPTVEPPTAIPPKTKPEGKDQKSPEEEEPSAPPHNEKESGPSADATPGKSDRPGRGQRSPEPTVTPADLDISAQTPADTTIWSGSPATD